ncbi:DEAD/DEAH box helicase [Simiduia curdlanivorans]|uniref:ATP-dependent RNA helicase DeaD n=1 Tax=Simiduia curdlanivorans TaxID=1492769 RepID=A0ABV8V7W3_9GAMM|nr:DEAD/DEAH box helicase [Simiduia curdlanivorans]MDN3639684.1 DEAD/DEAH box helicase [Simiduia curdlanivorans]
MSLPTSFADLALAPAVLKAVADLGYEQPSPIQAQAIPHLLEGRDILGVAQTGTGKTAAFALPLLTRVDASSTEPQVLVLTPTRELAIQVAEAFQRYATHIRGFHVLPIYGGQDMRAQLRQLQRGAQVVVGTPGRVMDHLGRGSLKLDNLRAIVLDEADEMLRMGFIDDVEWILEHTPKQRQTALFSATMPVQIKKVADRYLSNPAEVKISPESSTGSNIEQRYWMVSGTNKMDALTRILEVENFDAMIIFVRTKTATVELAEKLEARGFSASAINGDMNQALRERTIERLKQNKLDILVATDVAARGIDVERVSHVMNFDIPYDSEAYVHRIGRTGRAGRSGKAIMFVAPREKRLLYAIEKATNQRIERMELPTGDAVTKQRIDQFNELLMTTLTEQRDQLDFFYQLLAEFSKANDVSAEEIASVLAYLCQKERPLQVKLADVPNSRDFERRDDRGSRNERDSDRRGGDRKDKRERNKGPREDIPMDTYRLEVGRDHGVKPGDIVGAIANEAGIDSRHIGNIRLQGDHSTVELPTGMPKDTLAQLRRVFIRSQPINISLDAGGSPNNDSPYGGDKKRSYSSDKPRSDKPRSDRPARGDKPLSLGDKPAKKTRKPSDAKPKRSPKNG